MLYAEKQEVLGCDVIHVIPGMLVIERGRVDHTGTDLSYVLEIAAITGIRDVYEGNKR